MKIEQFEDKGLSHYSYAVLSEDNSEMIVIDPAREADIYINFAKSLNAAIVGVIETHPHADFVSSHLELYERTGAIIYCSKLLAADYPHQTFDEGDVINLGRIRLKALNTPGHSPDGICVLAEEGEKDVAVFTGDTLFIGDCGRPDLRESAGNLVAEREVLARQMYHSLRGKLSSLGDDVLVYPAHGAGTLCGKALSEANSSTIGAEKRSNWALQSMTEEQFISKLLSEQPFIPQYFAFDVELNKQGAGHLENALGRVSIAEPLNSPADLARLDPGVLIVDVRPSALFKAAHLPNSVNIMAKGKFETWLGSIVKPGEPFYLAAADESGLSESLKRAARIGYERFIKEAFVLKYANISSPSVELEDFKKNPAAYSIIDVRSVTEVEEKTIFENALNIPLPELRERVNEVPADKPVIVHCAGGYRSAAASSILENAVSSEIKVLDLGAAVTQFE